VTAREHPSEAQAPPIGSYRFGNHNPRNIYRSGVDRDTDEQVGVMFTPEMGRLVVIALNALVSEGGAPDA
jgi:hypothetical protein